MEDMVSSQTGSVPVSALKPLDTENCQLKKLLTVRAWWHRAYWPL